MSEYPRIIDWENLEEGMSVDIPFTVSKEDMDCFAKLSGDISRIHVDENFAHKNNFSAPVVYGALTVARLSYLVGMYLPGDLGLATSWKIDFNKPLYVGEHAIISADLSHKSNSTHSVKLKFRVSVGDKLVASGTAESKILSR